MGLAQEAERHTPQQRDGLAPDIQDVVDTLYSELNLKFKSVLTQRQVVTVATALTFAREYGVDPIYNVVENLLMLKVSQNGRGLNLLKTVLTSFFTGKQEGDDFKEYDRLRH